MRALALLLLALPLPLAACDGSGGGTTVSIDAKLDGDGNSTVSLANGTLAVKAEGFEGAIRMPKIKIGAADFDVNGLKLYPDSVIHDLHVDAEDRSEGRDKGRVSVQFESPAALATVQQWFRDRLAKQHFKINEKGNGFVGTTADGDPFALTLDADGNARTKGRIEVGS